MKRVFAAVIALGLVVAGWMWLAPVTEVREPGAAVPPVAKTPPPPPAQLSHGRFEDVTVYRPAGTVRQFVLFLSGDGGWDADMASLAGMLAEEGALVAGIDMPQLVTALEGDGGECVFPDGDLENLSHYIQAYYEVPAYLTPLLVGYSSGATLSYAMLAQSGPQIFAGAITLGFCADLEMKKALCKGVDIHQKRRADGGTDLLPAARLPEPWIVLHGEEDGVCPAAPAKAFVDRIPGTTWIALPAVEHDYSSPPSARLQLRQAVARFAVASAATVGAAPQGLSGLPLIEVGARGTGERFAVLLSGDGGWAGLDKEVAAALAAEGVPVVGFDSLRYFWKARTPEGLAADLDRILLHYAAQWNRKEAILIGYSQGADVLPFAVNRLGAASNALVVRTVLMGLGEKAAFEFHLSNWIGKSGDLPILPEVSRLSADRTLCLYGSDDKDSLCPRIPAGHVQARALPGGHHFDGAYGTLAKLILAAQAP